MHGHHLAPLVRRAARVSAHQRLQNLPLQLGDAEQRKRDGCLGVHGDALGLDREHDTHLAVRLVRPEILVRAARRDHREVLARVRHRRAPLLVGGDVFPNQLLDDARVVRHDNLARKRAVLELRAEREHVRRAVRVEPAQVLARHQRPHALGFQRERRRAPLRDHHAQRVAVRKRLVHVRAHDDLANLTRRQRQVARRRRHLKRGLAVPRERAELRRDGAVVAREDAPVRIAQNADFAEPDPEGSRVVRRLGIERRRGRDVSGQRIERVAMLRRARGVRPRLVHRALERLEKTHERPARGGFDRHRARRLLRPDAHHRERHADDAQVVRAQGHDELRRRVHGERSRIGRRRPARQLRRERVLRRDDEFRGHARRVGHRHDAALLVLKKHLAERQGGWRHRQLRHSALRADRHARHRVTDARYVQQNLLDVQPLRARHELHLDLLLPEGQDRACRGEHRELRPRRVHARHAQREPHRNLARVSQREGLGLSEPERGDAKVHAARVDVRRELRADDAPAEVQERVALGPLHRELERLVERAQRLAAQSDGDRARLAHGERAGARLKRKHAPRVRRALRVVAALAPREHALDLAAVHELHLVLVHGANEHVAHLQRVVVEHRERANRLPPKRQRQPVLSPLDVHEARRERLPGVVRVETHRHLELASGLDLAAQRRHRERGVLEEKRVRAERAVEPFAPRRERHSLGAQDVVLVR